MGLFNTQNALSYVINDIRERKEHAMRQREGKWHVYHVQASIDAEGRAYLPMEVIADLLFEESIFHLDAAGRKAARRKRASALRRQACASGKVISFKRYCRERSEWPEIDPEILGLVERFETRAETTIDEPVTEAVPTAPIQSDEIHEIWAPLNDSDETDATSEQEEIEAFPTAVERLLEETDDESIRKQIEVIFSRNPELEDLANREDCILQLRVTDGKVSVGRALHHRAQA